VSFGSSGARPASSASWRCTRASRSSINALPLLPVRHRFLLRGATHVLQGLPRACSQASPGVTAVPVVCAERVVSLTGADRARLGARRARWLRLSLWPLDRAASAAFCSDRRDRRQAVGRFSWRGWRARSRSRPASSTHARRRQRAGVARAAGGGRRPRDPLVRLAGCVVGDLAGFSARRATRGVRRGRSRLTFSPRSDSAYGGKNGRGLPEAKNTATSAPIPACRALLVDPTLSRPACPLRASPPVWWRFPRPR